MEELQQVISNTQLIIDQEGDNKTEWTKALNLIGTVLHYQYT